jgi:hypothetical protein
VWDAVPAPGLRRRVDPGRNSCLPRWSETMARPRRGGVTGDVVHLEPWLDTKGLEAYSASSERWIENCMADGMPHVKIAGRIKFKASEVEPWLEENRHMERIA